MSIQDIRLSNKQLKKLRKTTSLGDTLQLDDNGELVVHVAAYSELKNSLNDTPVESICGDIALDSSADYWVFSD